jgi:DNA-directed RNA polymerase subunit RPC12/RpoP
MMGQLVELEYSKMKYPHGRCSECGEVFSDDLRNMHHITHCPYCGTEIDDFLSFIDTADEEDKKNDLFCDDCGRRIYEATPDGKGGNYIDTYAGVCGDGCGRELCGKCGDWDLDTGLCADCYKEDLRQGEDGKKKEE